MRSMREVLEQRPKPVAAGRQAEPLDNLQMDGFDWVHPTTGARARGTLMVDEGSSKVVTKIHAVRQDGTSCGNTSADERRRLEQSGDCIAGMPSVSRDLATSDRQGRPRAAAHSPERTPAIAPATAAADRQARGPEGIPARC